jgi:hypothetical protein
LKKLLKKIIITILPGLFVSFILLFVFINEPAVLEGGIGKTGYYDNQGLWVAKYEVDAPNINLGAGAKSEYVGIVAKLAAFTLKAKIRIVDISGIRIFFDIGIDLGSIGGEIVFDRRVTPRKVEKGELRLGASCVFGGFLGVSWEDIYEKPTD